MLNTIMTSHYLGIAAGIVTLALGLSIVFWTIVKN